MPLYVDHVSSGEIGKVIGEKRAKGQFVYGAVLASAMLTGEPQKATLITAPPIRSNPDNCFQLLGLLAS